MKKINILILSLLLVGCNNNNNSVENNSSSMIHYSGEWKNINARTVKTTYNTAVNPFNTVMTLKYFASDDLENKEETIEEVTNLFQSSVTKYHKQFDRHFKYYLDDSNKDLGYYKNIKDVNDSLDTNLPVKLDKETFELLKFGVEWTKYTNSYFNIFVGALTDYWDNKFAEYNETYTQAAWDKFLANEPYYNEESQKEINSIINAMPKTSSDIDKVLIFNDDTYEVTFNSLKDENGNSLGKISISTGGIAKGYATDLIKQELVNKGHTLGYLFSGASSISSLNKPVYNNSKGQFLSIVDPRTANKFGDDKKSAFGVYLKDEFNMSTSGNYTSGKSYKFTDKETGEVVTRHHIINALTGYPEYKENVSSVSIFSKTLSAGVLDVLSTALVNMSVNDGLAFRNKIKKDFNCDFEIIYIKVSTDKKTLNVISTSNFDGRAEKGTGEGIVIEYV